MAALGDWATMGTDLSESIVHPTGEQPEVDEWSAVADTFAGRVHIEWDTTAPVTPLGQLPFFIEYLKQGGVFDGWVADCPLLFTSPNAPRKRDVLGTLLLSVLAGHRRAVWTVALGVVGSLIGGFVATDILDIADSDEFDFGSFLIAVGTSALLLWAYLRYFAERDRRTVT